MGKTYIEDKMIMYIKYEDAKCVCCDKANVHSLLIDVREEKDKHFIICFDCAKYVSKAVDEVRIK